MKADRPMRVVSVNTSDRGGGAERTAWLLFNGFQRRGLESWLVVGDKKTDEPRVLPIQQNRRRYDGLPGYSFVLRGLKLLEAALGREDFHFPASRRLLSLTESPDLLLCHNLHGGYFDLRLLPYLSRKVPVFLILHDYWTTTGHCAYWFDCMRWRTGCGNCPSLATPPALQRDGSRGNWERKKDIFARCRLRVAVSTRQMLQQVQQSILAPAIHEARVLPYGLDLAVFQPGDRAAARRELGIPENVHLLLFVANQARSNPFKDYPTMRAALARLENGVRGQDVHFCCIGEGGPDERQGCVLIRHIPYVSSPAQLARYLQAANLYIHAARGETFGIAIAEAMACGLPVVASRVGGIPEVAVHQEHGLLVPPADPAAMAQAVQQLLDDPALRARLGQQAAASAHQRFDQEAMIDTLLAWFRETLQVKKMARCEARSMRAAR